MSLSTTTLTFSPPLASFSSNDTQVTAPAVLGTHVPDRQPSALKALEVLEDTCMTNDPSHIR